jgi:hypothetical protein
MWMVSTIIFPGNHSGDVVSKFDIFLVPEGPIPLIGCINPCWIPPLHEPQYIIDQYCYRYSFNKILSKFFDKSGY